MNQKNPYLNARREWNERYGSYISAVKMWRVIALVALLLCCVSVSAAIWLAAQSKVVPFVIETNKGEVTTVYKADPTRRDDERVIKAQIARLVIDIRSVTADPDVQTEMVRRVYSHLSSQFPAYRTVNQFFRENTPFDRLKNEGVTVVEVKQIMPISKNTWRIEWIESSRSENGVVKTPVPMIGTMQVVTGGTVDSNTLIYNPIGLRIKEIEWSKSYVSN